MGKFRHLMGTDLGDGWVSLVTDMRHQKGSISQQLGSIKRWYIYLHEWLVFYGGIHVGRCR